MIMESELIIIDGSSMLVTAYYGNLPKALLFEKDPEKKRTVLANHEKRTWQIHKCVVCYVPYLG